MREHPAPAVLVACLQQLDALEEAKVYLLLQARAGIRRMVLEVRRIVFVCFVGFIVSLWEGAGGASVTVFCYL
jgi:hypothetical protein